MWDTKLNKYSNSMFGGFEQSIRIQLEPFIEGYSVSFLLS